MVMLLPTWWMLVISGLENATAAASPTSWFAAVVLFSSVRKNSRLFRCQFEMHLIY